MNSEPNLARRPTLAIIGTRGYPSYYGGFETAVRRLAPFLADAGWDVTVYGRPSSLVASAEPRDERVKSRTTRGIESKTLSTLSYGLTSALDTCVRKPDVALIMNVANAFWIPMLKLRGIPTVINVDGIEWERAKWGRMAKAVFRLGARFAARFATRLVFDADAIAARWAREFRREGHTIPYGGDTSDYLPVESGLSHREYVLVVARFVPENSIAEFLDACEVISVHHKVVIVGSSGYGGEIEARVEELSHQNENVVWLGHVSDDNRLFSLWQHAGVYFHGHSVGGTNPALVQAMALGAPTVARDTVFNREVLDDTALYVRPEPGDIIAKILTLMSDPDLQRRLSVESVARAASSYSWDDVCARYDRALVDVRRNANGTRR